MSSREDGTVAVVDTGPMAVVQTVQVGDEPEHVEVTPDGRWVVVARPQAGELVLLDPETLDTVRKIGVGKEPHQIAFGPRP